MTRRGLAVATAAAACAVMPWVGSQFLGADLSVLFYPACLLAATLAISCLLVAIAAHPALVRKCVAVEQMPTLSIEVGASAQMRFRLTWVGPWARVVTAMTHLRWAQKLGPGLVAASGNRVRGAVHDGHTASYEVRPVRRGVHQVGPLTVEAFDLWGLWRADVRVAEGFAVLAVPRVHALAGASAVWAGDDDGTAIREYRAGDEMRRVHWKASAHRAKLMVRDDERSAAPGVTFVFEDRGVSADDLDFACEAIATAAVASHQTGHDVHVLSASGSVDVVVLVGRTVAPLLTALARVEPAPGEAASATGAARWFVRALVPAGRTGAIAASGAAQVWTYSPGDDPASVARAMSVGGQERPHA